MANIYDHILPIEEVKRYLRLIEIDDDEEDPDIERMIGSAIEFISKQTNYVFKAENRTYYSNDMCYVSVFDTPINTSDFGNYVPIYYSNYVKFETTNEVSLNVGFTSRDQVPMALIDCALQIIKVWYYEAEKNVNTTLLPDNVYQVINTYRRFISI